MHIKTIVLVPRSITALLLIALAQLALIRIVQKQQSDFPA